MALDVFHQVLKRLYDLAGGNPRQMVSVIDVLKQEKLFGSAEMILNKLHSEGWVTDAPTRDHVYVTTWGIEEVHRLSAPAPASAASAVAASGGPTPAAAKPAAPKNAAALRGAAAKARELAETLEELAAAAAGTSAQRKAKAKKALAATSSAVDEAFE